MLSSLTSTVFNDRVEIFFMNTYGKSPSGKPSKVSNPQKAFFLNQNRRFFAVSDREQSTIQGMVHAHLKRLLEGK